MTDEDLLQFDPALLGEERITKGYVRGVECTLVIRRVDGVWLETRTALAWLAMKAAAKADGINLVATDGWRSYETQEEIFNKRACRCVPKRIVPAYEHEEKCPVRLLGPAAKPGWSNHQSGIAVDIRVHLTVVMLAENKTSKEYRWLKANAARFGFKRTVKSEPWHWESRGIPEPRPENVS